MGKAWSANVNTITMENVSTTTMKAYSFCRLCTTANKVDIITTRGTVAPFGITQEAINPSTTGKIGTDGFSRLKMGSTGFTTMYVTTPMQIGSNASGLGVVLTTSTSLENAAVGLTVFAASDIVTVKIANFRNVWRV
jgi:hypothetical protein